MYANVLIICRDYLLCSCILFMMSGAYCSCMWRAFNPEGKALQNFVSNFFFFRTCEKLILVSSNISRHHNTNRPIWQKIGSGFEFICSIVLFQVGFGQSDVSTQPTWDFYILTIAWFLFAEGMKDGDGEKMELVPLQGKPFKLYSLSEWGREHHPSTQDSCWAFTKGCWTKRNKQGGEPKKPPNRH